MEGLMSFQDYLSSYLLCNDHGAGSFYKTQGPSRRMLRNLGHVSALNRLFQGLEVNVVGSHKLIEAVVLKVVLNN